MENIVINKIMDYMKIIKLLIKYLLPFLKEKFPNLMTEPDTDPNMEKEPVSLDIIDPAAFLEASMYLRDNLISYKRSSAIEWKGGVYEGKRYGIYTLTQTAQGYFKVMMNISVKGFHTIATMEISGEKYFKYMHGRPLYTWCNMFLGGYTGAFLKNCGAPKKFRNLQWWNGKQFNANQLIVNLQSGFYNTKYGRFIQIDDIDDAVDHAYKGGLAFASLHLPGGDGHVGVFTGKKGVEYPLINEAGLHTGFNMPLDQGFGEDNLDKLQYWKLIKNDNTRIT